MKLHKRRADFVHSKYISYSNLTEYEHHVIVKLCSFYRPTHLPHSPTHKRKKRVLVIHRQKLPHIVHANKFQYATEGQGNSQIPLLSGIATPKSGKLQRANERDRILYPL